MSSDPAAPIAKRAHRKSRGGCHTCKRRKVKCDEKRPLCGNCARRFNDIDGCDFIIPGKYLLTSHGNNNPPTSAIPRRRRPPPEPSTAITVRPSGINISNSSTRSLELRLFYHFTTSTINLLPLAETHIARPLWTVDTPMLAFDNEHLLLAVLSTAALHMHTLNPKDESLSHIARRYFGQAIQMHRETVAQINANNAEAAVVASMLLSLTHRHNSKTSPEEPYHLPIERFYMVQGMRSLLYASLPHIQNSNVLTSIYAWPPHPSNPSNPSNPFLDRRLLGFPQNMQKVPELRMPPDLNDLKITDDDTKIDPNIIAITLPLSSVPPSDPNYRTYSVITAYLLTIYRAFTMNEPLYWIRRRIEAMIVFTPSDVFLGLLLKHDPLALSLLARYFALMKAAEGVWFLDGLGGYEVRGIATLMPKEYGWLNDWPMYVVENGLLPFEEDGELDGKSMQTNSGRSTMYDH